LIDSKGLQVSLAGAKGKLAQLDTATQRHVSNVELAMPTFTSIASRITSTAPAADQPPI
jgi:hypothetical protein